MMQQKRLASLLAFLLAMLSVLLHVAPAHANSSNGDITAVPSFLNLTNLSPNASYQRSFTVTQWDLAEGPETFTVSEFIPSSFVFGINPPTFTLNANESQLVTFTVQTTHQSFFATTFQVLGDCQSDAYVPMNGYLSPMLGVEDYVAIAAGPSLLTPGTTVSYQAKFTSVDSAHAQSWAWKIQLYGEGGGSDYSSASFPITAPPFGTTWGSETSSMWSPTLPDLPPGKWARDANGNVRAQVLVTTTDSDGSEHEFRMDAAIVARPDTPKLGIKSHTDSSATFEFLADGATSYKMWYGTDSGNQLFGIGATEGPSPVSVSGSATELTIHGLDFVHAGGYFRAQGYNAAGENGALSAPVTVGVVRTVPGLSPSALVMLMIAVMLTGAYATTRQRKALR